MKKLAMFVAGVLIQLSLVPSLAHAEKAFQLDCSVNIRGVDDISYSASFYGDMSTFSLIGGQTGEVIKESFVLNNVPLDLRVLFTTGGNEINRISLQLKRSDMKNNFYYAEGYITESDSNISLMFSGTDVNGEGIASAFCERR